MSNNSIDLKTSIIKNCFVSQKIKYNNENYVAKIRVKLPITNIIGLIVNDYKTECFITLKKSDINIYKYYEYKNSRGIFIKSNDHIYCNYSPQARKLDLCVKNNYIKYMEKTGLSGGVYEEYLKILPPLQGGIQYDKILKNEYKYYYCLYLYMFINYNNNDINNSDFIKFINETDININTLEEYLQIIASIEIDSEKNMEQYNFIRYDGNFIFLPLYTYITINDILLLKKNSYGCIRYCNIAIQIIYTYNKPINHIIDAGDMIDSGIMTTVEWDDLLQSVEEGTVSYFKILFGILEFETQLSKDNPEIIDGIKSFINITVSIYPTEFFSFTAKYYPNGFDLSVEQKDYLSIINIYDLMEYSRMKILNKLTYNFISSPSRVPVYYYNRDIRTINSLDISFKNLKEFDDENKKDIILNIGNTGPIIPKQNNISRSSTEWNSKQYTKATLPPKQNILPSRTSTEWERKQYTTLPLEQNISPSLSSTEWKRQQYTKTLPLERNILPLSNVSNISNFDGGERLKKYIIIKKGGFRIINKINIMGQLNDISREDILEIIKTIVWDGSITQYGCNIRIYGKNEEKNYVLYIIAHGFQNTDIEDMVNNKMKKIFENTFIHYIDYDLYLHVIPDIDKNERDSLLNSHDKDKYDIEDDSDIEDDTFKEKVPSYLKKKQSSDVNRDILKIQMDKSIRDLIKKKSLNKFSNTSGEEQKLFITDTIYIREQLEEYNIEYYEKQSFPEILIKKGIFKFTSFLMVTDKTGNNPKILNSAEIDIERLENINKGPLENSINKEKKWYSQLGIIISPENKPYLFVDNDEKTINSMMVSPGLEKFISDMVNNVFEKNDFFKLTGYFFPWREDNTERIFNIFDLKISDLDYIEKIINNFIESIIIFFNKLNINKKYLLNIGMKNIEIYFHYPNSNADIHLQCKIYKDIHNTEEEYTEIDLLQHRRYITSYTRRWSIEKVINLLKFNYFENLKIFTTMIAKKRYISIIKYKELIIENIDPGMMIIGGENRYSFIQWIDKYLNYDKIFKNYILPSIFIDFEIIEEKKTIIMETLYNKILFLLKTI